MTNFSAGDKVKCVKTIYAGDLPSILVGHTGDIVSISGELGKAFPICVRFNSSAMCGTPYIVWINEDEIELVSDQPEKTYSEPESGG